MTYTSHELAFIPILGGTTSHVLVVIKLLDKLCHTNSSQIGPKWPKTSLSNSTSILLRNCIDDTCHLIGISAFSVVDSRNSAHFMVNTQVMPGFGKVPKKLPILCLHA